MDTQKSVNKLIHSGDIPRDAVVVSENNKIVVISPKERIVARIGTVASANQRDDPHDLRYSHNAAWLAGDDAPVVRPLHKYPIVRGEHLISTYPLLDNATHLDTSKAQDIFTMTNTFGKALARVEAGMDLRKLDVGAYVQERLDAMTDDPLYDQQLVNYVHNEVQAISKSHPFVQLVDADRALVHGDFKADNVVIDELGTLKAIDLDAVAIGPRLYDIASWRLRREMGDDAPVEEAVAFGRTFEHWNEDAYHALIGWKAISSMSFTLRYEVASTSQVKVTHIAQSATALGGLSGKLPQ